MKASRSSLIALVAVLCLWTADPALAAPIKIKRDRSDNTMYFTYNPTKGEIPSAYSSRLLVRGDRVEFFAYVRERPGADVGRRLAGTVKLRVNRHGAVRYNGRFIFIIEDSDGSFERWTRRVNFVLRPRAGHRKRSLRWVFDLPDPGTYTAYARFRSAG
jgi:hypothetical protein